MCCVVIPILPWSAQVCIIFYILLYHGKYMAFTDCLVIPLMPRDVSLYIYTGNNSSSTKGCITIQIHSKHSSPNKRCITLQLQLFNNCSSTKRFIYTFTYCLVITFISRGVSLYIYTLFSNICSTNGCNSKYLYTGY